MQTMILVQKIEYIKVEMFEWKLNRWHVRSTSHNNCIFFPFGPKGDKQGCITKVLTVQLEPMPQKDPLGLVRVQVCLRVWWEWSKVESGPKQLKEA